MFISQNCTTNCWDYVFILLLDIFQYLHDTLNERIMVIDGAMGTMIQQHNLDEDAFRGMLFIYMSGI